MKSQNVSLFIFIKISRIKQYIEHDIKYTMCNYFLRNVVFPSEANQNTVILSYFIIWGYWNKMNIVMYINKHFNSFLRLKNEMS